MPVDGTKRVVIERVTPQVDGGRFPVKRVEGETVEVEADIFCDGHDEVRGRLLHRAEGESDWQVVPMAPLGNDRWRASFIVHRQGLHYYAVEGAIDRFATWRHDLGKKWEAGQQVSIDLLAGAAILERGVSQLEGEERTQLEEWAALLRTGEERRGVLLGLSEELNRLMQLLPRLEDPTLHPTLIVSVDREKALFSSWYEIFPRSCAFGEERHGTFNDCIRYLPEIAAMGFDVLYLPPIHPIGRVNRKGRNNSPVCAPGDHGCPWAIGAEEGGHTAVHPALGTLEEFDRLVKTAAEVGIEVALDVAFQCAPDHPWVATHPHWFKHRPDGSIQYAENPPKKYEDVVPFDFECDDWENLWQGLKGVFDFWIGRGVRIFRVDNPHTKPIPFWEWVIAEIKREHPGIIFLAEAFTRPKVMYRLAKIGFTQSYTYFTWRTTKRELTDYLTELTRREPRQFFRPNFWPNTPDILHEFLQIGGKPAFAIRLLLAATLSSNYGIYGPPYELCVGDALPGREEYLDSEKYEVRHWNLEIPGHLRDLIARLNAVRKSRRALQTTWNVRFCETDNDRVIAYLKTTEDLSDCLLVVVSLDPFRPQSAGVRLPSTDLKIPEGEPYLVHDLLGEERFIWDGEWNAIDLDPRGLPGKIFSVHRRLRREQDFDYYF